MEEALHYDSSLSKTRWMARGMMLFAFAIPFLTMNSYSTPFRAGQRVGEMGMGLLFIMLIVFTVFRKSNDTTKARATLAVAIVLVALSGFKSVTEYQETIQLKSAAARLEQQITIPVEPVAATSVVEPAEPAPVATKESDSVILAMLMDKVAVSSKKQVAKIETLNSQATALDMGSALSPAALTNAASIQNSRETLRKFAAIQKEYRQSYVDAFNENEQILRNCGWAGATLDNALATFNNRKKETFILLDNITRAQKGTMSVAGKILDICTKGLGYTELKDGNILFSKPELLKAYQQQITLLMKLVADEERAQAEFDAAAKKQLENIKKDLTKLQR